MEPSAEWFYEKGGRQLGPFTEEELLSLVERDEITVGALVWRDGMDDWVSLREAGLEGLKIQPPSIQRRWTMRKAAIREGFRPQIRSTLARGWQQLFSDFWPYVGASLVVSVLYLVISQFYVTLFFLMFPCSAGLFWYFLLRARGQPTDFYMIFEGFRRQFGSLALLNLIVVGVQLLLIGILLLALCALVAWSLGFFDSREDPGTFYATLAIFALLLLLSAVLSLMVGIAGSFAMLLLLDCEVTLREAWRLSWEVTKKWWLKLIFFIIVIQILGNLGMLLLFVGVFISAAWVGIAFVHLYEDAFGDS